MKTLSVRFTRPANTTPYGAGDVIGIPDVDTAANAGSALHAFAFGPNAIITTAALRWDETSIPATMTTMVLHLYAGAPDARLDAATWIKTSANDKRRYRGSITLTPAVSGGDLWVMSDGINKQLATGAEDEPLYVQLVTTGGFTPASGTEVEIYLSAIEK